MIAKFDTNSGRVGGRVIKINALTVLVLCAGKIIKRHKEKHNVTFSEKE